MDAGVDVAVIGRGMLGSAAARHLAESGVRVALVGPDEPRAGPGAVGPFGSHFDEGRITRITAFAPEWSALAARSIERYGDIAARSGIEFHDPCGLVVLAASADQALAHGRADGAHARIVDAEWLRETSGIVGPRDRGHRIVHEWAPAGLVNPRRLVAAQTRLADVAGAAIVRSPVVSVHRNRTSDRATSGITLVTAAGEIRASRVLLTTGAYGAGLIGVELALERRLRTIVRADVGPDPLPCLILDDPDHPDLDECYWVPPLRFPDGRTLLKIGGDSRPCTVAESDAEIDAWFARGGSADEAGPLAATIAELLPDRPIAWSDHKPCVVTYTPTGLPFIGWVDDGVAVCLAGCGAAAKSSDELGRLGASVVTGRDWPTPGLSPESFTPIESRG